MEESINNGGSLDNIDNGDESIPTTTCPTIIAKIVTFNTDFLTRLKEIDESIKSEFNDLKQYSESIEILDEQDFKTAFLENQQKCNSIIKELDTYFIENEENLLKLYRELLHELQKEKDEETGIIHKFLYLFSPLHHSLDSTIKNTIVFILKPVINSSNKLREAIKDDKEAKKKETKIISIFDTLSKLIFNLDTNLENCQNLVEEFINTFKQICSDMKMTIFPEKEKIEEEKELSSFEEVKDIVENIGELDELDDITLSEDGLNLDDFGSSSSASKDSSIDAEKYGIINDGGTARDGNMKLKITKDGVFIKIKPAYNGGFPIIEKDVTALLNESKVSLPSDDTISKLVHEPKDEFLKIGEWTPNPEYDSKMDIIVEEDDLFAYLKIIPPKYSGRRLDISDIEKEIKSKGIAEGIDSERVNKIINENLHSIYLLIAKGRKGEAGEAGYIDFLFRTNLEDIHLEADDKGKVDYRELNLIHVVDENETIAQKIKPTLGKKGVSVFGKELPPEKGEEATINLGQNVAFDENGIDIKATMNGHVQLKRNILSVEPILTIENDVDMNVGNIDFNGSVIIKGNVLDGFNIKATGDIEIFGTVGMSNIESDNNVLVKQGVLSHEKGGIKARGDILVRFITNAHIYTMGNLIVEQEVINSNVIAFKKVIVRGRKAHIVGGKVSAGHEILASAIGSDYFVPTFIEIGLPKNLKEQTRVIQDKINFLKQEIANHKKVIDVLIKKETKLGKLPDKLNEQKIRAIKFNLNQKVNLKSLESQQMELKNLIGDNEAFGAVIVLDTCYPEVTISISKSTIKLNKPIKRARFYYGAGRIALSGLTNQMVKRLSFRNRDKEEEEQNEAIRKKLGKK